MFSIQFKHAIRNLQRSKAFSLINIIGLSLGIASSVTIFLLVVHQLNYDRFNEKGDRIFRITTSSSDYNANVSMAVVPALRSAFPEFEHVTQVYGQAAGLITIGANRFAEKNYAFADDQFTSIFDLNWLEGNRATALSEPNAIVLTKSLEQKYFGTEKALGRLLTLDNQHALKVTGVIADLPGNTQLPFSFLVSFATVSRDLQAQGAMSQFYWINGGSFAYVLLPANLSASEVQARIPALMQKTWGADIAKNSTLLLQPLFEVPFDTRYINNIVAPTSKNVYYSLLAVGLLIIIIACINFINLTSTQAVRRAREMGIRKILGSSRKQLMIQLLMETSVLIFLSTLVSLILVYMGLDAIGSSLDIRFELQRMITPQIVVYFLCFLVGLVALAGLYPAFIQSAFNPARSLAGKISGGRGKAAVRSSFVAIQFAVSQALIIGTLVIAYQMDFLQNKELGYDKDSMVSFEVPDAAKRSLIADKISGLPGVMGISFSSAPPAYDNSYTNFNYPGMNEGKDDVTEVKSVDENYFSLFKLQMIAGTPVIPNQKTDADSVYDIVVTQTLIRKMRIQDPTTAPGKQINFNGRWIGTITGVVQDFQNGSKKNKIAPCILTYRASNFQVACVKLSPERQGGSLSAIDKAWSSLFPDRVFQYEFMDTYIRSLYRQESRQYLVFRLFALIAILIGSLGLFGLIRFTAAQRVKEVGIRKVLGASVTGILRLFTMDFGRLICIAFVFAAPVAWYVMSNWLGNFAYKIDIGPKVFLLAGASSALIAFGAIGYQVVSAARRNPALSLRSE